MFLVLVQDLPDDLKKRPATPSHKAKAKAKAAAEVAALPPWRRRGEQGASSSSQEVIWARIYIYIYKLNILEDLDVLE